MDGIPLYGNTLAQWALVLLGVFLSLFLSRTLYWALKRWGKPLAAYTKTNLNELLLAQIRGPLAAGLFLVGLRLSLGFLTLPEAAGVSLNHAFSFAGTLLLAWAITALYEAFHQQYVQKSAEKRDTASRSEYILPFIRASIKLIVWSLAIIAALNNVGYDVTTILTGLGIGGLAFALAAQHTFGDFVAGINLFLDHHFKIGDRIQFHHPSGALIDGIVEDIGIRRTLIRTRYEGRLVIVPNAILANQPVVNVSTEKGRQVYTLYKLSPALTAQQIETTLALLEQAAAETPDIMPTVFTGLMQITEISKDIIFMYWIKPGVSNIKTRTALNLAIMRKFEAHNIAFAEKVHYEYQKQSLL